MKRFNKKIVILGLFILLMTGVWGCGKKSADNTPATVASKDYIYKAFLDRKTNRLIVCCVQEIVFMHMDLSGTKKQKLLL